jgi:hypothetical protein
LWEYSGRGAANGKLPKILKALFSVWSAFLSVAPLKNLILSIVQAEVIAVD